MQVVKVGTKVFVGEKIVHAQIFPPEVRDTVFNLIYEDVLSGKAWVKRFTAGGITREKIYDLGRNAQKPKVLFCEPGPEKYVYIKLRKKPRIHTDRYFNFGDLLIKGRDAGGNTVSKHKISSVKAITAENYAKFVSPEDRMERGGDES